MVVWLESVPHALAVQFVPLTAQLTPLFPTSLATAAAKFAD
jgi:hypothetical protein